MQQAMAAITAVLLAALVGYLAAWYAGWLVGNFAAVLMLAVAVCGVYWLAEKWVFLPQRRRALAAAVAQWQARQDSAARAGVAPDPQPAPAAQQWLRQPWWLDWLRNGFRTECRYRSRLSNDRRTNKKILSQPNQGIHRRLGHNHPTQSPSGHSEVLGEAIHDESIVRMRKRGG